MGKLVISIGRGVLHCFSGLGCRFFSFNKQVSNLEDKPLIASSASQYSHLDLVKLEDVTYGKHTHLLANAIHSEPKVVVLKVSMHCNGCARKVQKHVSKMEGVISCKVNLETKMVVVTGDVIPLQVMESLSKVKTAQLWETDQTDTHN